MNLRLRKEPSTTSTKALDSIQPFVHERSCIKSTQTTHVTRPEIAVAISVALRLKINWTIEPVGWLSGLIDMENNKEIASLREQMLWLSRSLRIFIVAFVAASSFRLFTALRNGTEYKEFFGNMLAGAKIPDLTIFLADYHVHIYAASLLVSALVVFFVLRKNSKPALPALAAVVGVANFAFAEFANYWFWKPVAEVMRQLTG